MLEAGAVSAARQLIGWRLYSQEADGLVGGMIVETEAYTQQDAASHSYNGQTRRNQIMFGPAGYIYAYFTYGMHYCMNIVTGKQGDGEAVLIRALVPDKGLDTIRERRNNRPDSELTNGPAKVCQALNITRDDNGVKLGEGRFVLLPPDNTKLDIIATRRIGISREKDRLWRFITE